MAIDSEVVLKYFLTSDPLKQLSGIVTKKSNLDSNRVWEDPAFSLYLCGL